MKVSRLFRDIHKWASIIIAPVLLVMIGAGLVLMLKKDVAWIQPESATGTITEAAPDTPVAAIFAAASAVEQAGIESWTDIDRFDIKPDDGIAKLVSNTRWEVQVDLTTLEILAVNYRRSDLIESIHDGSFFAGWTKLFLFFPVGIALFGLLITGVYMFVQPYVFRWQARRKGRAAGRHPSN